MDSKNNVYRRVFVWELPVRFFHWLNALCIVVLGITGYIIGNPPAISSSKEAFQLYWFGTVRFIHFVTAFIFFFNFVFRLYWGFVGNKYAKWYNFIPYKKSKIKELFSVIKVDIFQIDIRGPLHIGHNALAGFSYFLTFLVFLIHSITGFALYSSMSDSFFPKLFNWVTPILGGDFAVRQWHHVMMWFFVIFALIHVYIIFYHDYIEGRSTASSMIGGWKFTKKEEFDSEKE